MAQLALFTPQHPPAARQRRLQVAACHRCAARQLVALPPALLQRGAAAVANRGPAAAQASKASREDTQQEPEVPAAPPASTSARQEGVQAPAASASGQQEVDTPGVRAALAALKFYKAIISPLIPPSCRYLPTCSIYAMESYKSFGVAKGTVLTAWRLMRCAPWGGRGIDNPKWPPPGLEFMFGGSGGSSGSGSSGRGSSGSSDDRR